MGLIRAAVGAAGGTMADQWKEFFYCEAMDKEVMVVKGTKRTSSRSSNKRGSDNIITSGSGIAVADGQCMMIVEQGKVVDICADPGEYTYDASTEPSIFAGSLGEGIRRTFQTIGKRFVFGGDTGKDQRVYYFNTKELVDNKFGTATPIPFRVVDSRIGLDIDVAVRCHGVYSYRIADPLLFYTNVCGNVEREYTREELDGQLKTEFVSALQPAFGRLSEMELRPNQIVTHNTELENAMNEVLSAKWAELRGLKVVSVALGSVTLPDEDAEYDETIDINLSELEPLIACPHQPDNVMPLHQAEKKRVQQVFIGSCTNASYADIAKAALVFKGHHVNEDVSCTCAVSSKQVYRQLMRDGYVEMLLDAGVRLLEIACGPCCAIGQTPATDGVAVRTSNRNFKGRAGNPTAKIYLVSPESAAATAIMGTFATAADILGDQIDILAAVHEKDEYEINDNLIIKPLPEEEAKKVEIVRGPNIKFLPVPEVPVQHLKVPVSLKGGDNISTDDITPASAEFSSMRSNIQLMSKYCYHRYDPEFSERAREMGSSIIIGGENYGQGSSREHAAINPMYLGVKCVIAKSIARIHKGNLVNHGIVPMLFEDPADYEKIDLRDELEIENFLDQIQAREVEVKDVTKGFTFKVKLDLTDNELEVVLCGGQLRYLKRELVKQGVIDKE